MFYLHVGFQVLAVVSMNSSDFWHTTPYRSLKVDRRFGVTYCLKIQGRSKSEAKSRRKEMNLKMEAICPSETSVDFQRNTQRYVAETELVISVKEVGVLYRPASADCTGASGRSFIKQSRTSQEPTRTAAAACTFAEQMTAGVPCLNSDAICGEHCRARKC
jgi:hypothetical protein